MTLTNGACRCTVMDIERPLITYFLLSYNQERYLRSAIDSAFAQSYTPLEIVLSDDCSSDRSYEIMCEMADSYNGPHEIVLNRNLQNLGIGGHFNKGMQLAHGELIVAAAGDDISLPERTAVLHEAWLASNKQAFSLFSDAIFIDENDRHLKNLYGENKPALSCSPEAAVQRGGVGVAGCTQMFSKKTFDYFGPMDVEVMAEDMVIPFRSLLLGDVHYINSPLVLYRIHSGNISIDTANRPSIERRCREKINHEAVLLTWLNDVRVAYRNGLLSSARTDLLKSDIIRQLQSANLERQFYLKPFMRGLLFLLTSSFCATPVASVFKMVERRLRSR